MNSDARPKGIRSNLVALSAAAVLTVYAAGFARTRAAAQRFDGDGAERRPAAPNTGAPIPAVAVARPAAEPAAGVPGRAPQAGDVAGGAGRAVAAATVPPHHPSTVPGMTHPVPRAVAEATDSAAAPVAVTAVVPAVLPAGTPSTASSAGVAADTATQVTETVRGQFKDGVYTGWGSSRHGDIQASVEIKDGRIVGASISQCLTRYSCSWISRLPPQVVARQSADVDYVSGATQSTNAFYYAVVEALSKAK